MATLVLGVLMVAALRTLGGAGLARAKTTDRALARGLADALATEIMARAYMDPGPAPVFGLEIGEAASPRTGYDDTDDYNALTESPPQEADGTAIVGTLGLQRTTTVEWVSPTDLTAVSATEAGAKRITVTVTRNGTPLARRVVVRTSAG